MSGSRGSPRRGEKVESVVSLSRSTCSIVSRGRGQSVIQREALAVGVHAHCRPGPTSTTPASLSDLNICIAVRPRAASAEASRDRVDERAIPCSRRPRAEHVQEHPVRHGEAGDERLGCGDEAVERALVPVNVALLGRLLLHELATLVRSFPALASDRRFR